MLHKHLNSVIPTVFDLFFMLASALSFHSFKPHHPHECPSGTDDQESGKYTTRVALS
jgi:hypothetical protein